MKLSRCDEVWYMQMYNLQQSSPKPVPVLFNSSLYSSEIRRNPILVVKYGDVYHGSIQRHDADNVLRGCYSGSFLIRDAFSSDHAVTLAIKFDDDIKIYRLYYDNCTNEHFVGEKRFVNVESLVADGLIHFYVESRGADFINKIESSISFDERSPYMLERERYYTLQIRQQSQHNPDHHNKEQNRKNCILSVNKNELDTEKSPNLVQNFKFQPRIDQNSEVEQLSSRLSDITSGTINDKSVKSVKSISKIGKVFEKNKCGSISVPIGRLISTKCSQKRNVLTEEGLKSRTQIISEQDEVDEDEICQEEEDVDETGSFEVADDDDPDLILSSSSDSGVNSSHSSTSHRFIISPKRGSSSDQLDNFSQNSQLFQNSNYFAVSGSQRDSVCSSSTLNPSDAVTTPTSTNHTLSDINKSFYKPGTIIESESTNFAALNCNQLSSKHKQMDSPTISSSKTNILFSLSSPLLLKSTKNHINSTNKNIINNNNNINNKIDIVNAPAQVENTLKSLALNAPRAHHVRQTTFLGPHWCDVCSHFMWGLVQQGMVCQDCGMRAHKKCAERALSDCIPDMKLMRRVFGVELTSLVIAENTIVPNVLVRLIEELELRGGYKVEGIYRECGMFDDIEELKALLNKDVFGPYLSQYRDNNVFSSLIKKFFQLLPIPLISFTLFPIFLKVSELSNNDAKKFEQVQSALKCLPVAHFNTLEYLMRHLRLVSDNSLINQMDSTNLGRIFSPTLIRTQFDSSGSGSQSTLFTLNAHSMHGLMSSVNRENAFIKYLIDHWPGLFHDHQVTRPASLLTISPSKQ